MKVHPIWDNFSLGELSPRLWSNSEIAARGASHITNWIVTAQGSLKRREGTRFLGTIPRAKVPGTPDVNRAVRTERMARIMEYRSNEHSSSAIVLTRDEGNSVCGWRFTRWGKHPDEREQKIENTGFRFLELPTGSNPIFHGIWDYLGVFDQNSVRSSWYFLSGMYVGFSEPSSTYWNGVGQQSGNEGDSITNWAVAIDVEMPDGNVNLVVGVHDSKADADSRTYLDQKIISHPGRNKVYLSTAGRTSVYLSIVCEGGQLTDEGEECPRYQIRHVFLFDGDNEPGPEKITPEDTTLRAEDLLDVQYSHAPEDGSPLHMTFGVQSHPQYMFVNGNPGNFGDYIEFSQYPITDPPDDWDIFAPRTLAFYQGRLWYAGLANRVWASRSGDYSDFTPDTQVTEESPLDWALTQQGTIKWMLPIRNMLMGTEHRELLVNSTNGTISNADLQISVQSSNGSKFVQAQEVGNHALYVTADGSKIRTSFYRWEEDAWKSRDVTYLAEHMFTKDPIKRIAYTRQPDRILWILTNRGNLYGATFDDNLEFVGYHRHDVGGEVLDIARGMQTGQETLYLLVLRGPGEYSGIRDYISVEALDNTCGTFDGEITHYNGVQDDRGLVHAGKDIQAIVDGVFYDKATINETTGHVENIPAWSNELRFGLPFKATVRTLPMDFSTQAGSTPSWPKRWNKLFARFYTEDADKFPLINEQRASGNVPQQIPSGVVDFVIHNLGFDNQGVIEVTQDLPYHSEFLGIFGEMGQSRL